MPRAALFARGETITREGAMAHHLYILLSGSVSVRVGGLEDKREVGLEAFRSLLARHPDLAERVAQVLAGRETGLVAAKDRLGSEQREKLRAQKERPW
ncbi:MAG: hypothetical protein JWN04_524 [Myxococcaceae bacterium]|nr:hypothetical protein [Myxococcaceae bacterium]